MYNTYQEGKMEGKGFIQRCKPYIAVISLQFGYAGMNIITKVSLDRGMSHYVLVAHRHAFATAVIAPFALVLERKARPKISFPIFMQIFLLGLLGPVIDQNFYYAGLKFTSPTFSCAMSNMLPVMAFVIAVICRMEKSDLKKVRCQAKVIGTIVTVAGAMLIALFKGQVIKFFWTDDFHYVTPQAHAFASGFTDKNWFNGSILLFIAILARASFFMVQAVTLKRYSAQLSLFALVCFIGTLQSTAVTYVMEGSASVWTIGWDIGLLAAAYAGIVSSGIAYCVHGIVTQHRGPVFVDAFSPLAMIIAFIMGSSILAEKIYLGGVIGAVLMVMGLYSVLWGKYKENKEKEGELIPEASKADAAGNGSRIMATVMEDITGSDIEMHKCEAHKHEMVVIVVRGPIPRPPLITVEAPKS